MKRQEFVKLAVLTVLLLAAYAPTFVWMVNRWSVKDTYYSHGFLVPFISMFIAWLNKEKLGRLPVKPIPGWGWLVFGLGIFVHTVSAFWRVGFASGFALIPVIAGLILLFFGKDYLKTLAFPILFLIFMIPLPMVAIANISFQLKIIASQAATAIVNSMGVAAVREGSVIKTMHSYLVVEDPCSGIRSLIALIALGALMAYFSKISRVKKSILFLSSIPIAIGTNVIRIVALTLASEIYGSKFTTGVFHNTMGILVFVMAFAALAFVSKILE